MDVCESERSNSAVVSSGLCSKNDVSNQRGIGITVTGIVYEDTNTEGFRSGCLYELGDLQGREICCVVTDALAHEDPSSPRRVAIHIPLKLKHVHTYPNNAACGG